MSNKFIIALDQGSSSSRTLAFDQSGAASTRAARSLSTRRSAEGLAEFDAAEMYRGQLDTLTEVLDRTGAPNAAALAVATQRSTVVFWDRLTGEPVAPALSWQDGRALAQAEQVTLSQASIHQLTGLYKTPFYSAAKIVWTLQNVPSAARAAADGRLCIGPVASYIIWHLTHGEVFACDPTLAQRTLLFNITTLNWDQELLHAFGIDRAWLPQIKRSADDYGTFEYNGVRIPIRACVGDQQAALLALRVVSGGACINYGTGAFFMRNTGVQRHILPGLLTSVAASAGGKPGEYLLEGPVNACATLFSWLNQLGFPFSNEELDVLYEMASAPIWLLPALGGLGAPYWDYTVSPVMAGFSPRTQKADVAAGAVNAVALLMADIIFYAERYGLKSRDIKVTGGLSRCRSLLKTQANILQTRLLPCAEAESTACGAALLAAPSVGVEASNWETMRLLPPVSPALDPEKAQQLYERWHAFLNWCKKA